ncbi:MAG: Rrf2 family transcriptional regulator [Chitinophagales bacterium]|nr:Rrf2 family transcriptional regulator [Chitinophagales bacterium]
MFSKASEYAIKAMIYIAGNSNENKKISVIEIAKAINAPRPFIAKILQILARKKVLKSSKGPKGGFYLTKNELSQSVAQIIYAMDGNIPFENCVLGLEVCSEENPCPLHYKYKEIRKDIIDMIENNTLDEFIVKLKKGEIFLKSLA